MKSTSNNSVYLDHAAATPVSRTVQFAMQPYLSDYFYNPSAPYAAAVDVREAYEAARHDIARAIGARPANVVLTAGATEANELALGGFVRVAACESEHPSILAHINDGAEAGAKSASLDLQVKMLPNGLIDLEDLRVKAAASEVVSVSLVNSESGIVQPVAEIAEAVHAAGALLHIDASQAASTFKLNVARLGADLMTLNSGKIYGPKQVGVLYVRSGVKLKPLVRGGGQEAGLRSGTENVAGVIGFAAALTTAQEHVETERKRLLKLKNTTKSQILASLAEAAKGFRFLFDNKHQSAGFLVIETGLDAERLVMALEERGVLVGTGAACAANKREASKVLGGSALRLSFGKLNDERNVKAAAKIIAEEILREQKRTHWRSPTITDSSPKQQGTSAPLPPPEGSPRNGSKSVIVGLSGGVDSSVAAALLLEQGYDVKGVYMKNWSRDLPGMRCPWKEDLADAKRVATKLGIDFEVWDFEKQYFDTVVKTFVDGCKDGLTPNPDILCNESIKFKAFLERAEADGADFVATGHYARIQNGKMAIPKDLTKDQTYFLYRMPTSALEKVIFPLGELLKAEVKQLAKARGFRTAQKKESMGMCFVGDTGMEEFLGEFIKENPGEIVDFDSGKTVGKHKGVAFYTLGQRHGLYLGGGVPYYVTGKDVEKNVLYVAKSGGLTGVKELKVGSLHWLQPNFRGKKMQVRTRHLGELTPAEFEGGNQEGGEGVVRFLRDARAVASGQSVVFYDAGGGVLGGGIVQ
jgi:tRNA-specific 2-thiouridylase